MQFKEDTGKNVGESDFLSKNECKVQLTTQKWFTILK